MNIQINRYILTTMQERFAPQITEIEPNKLEKRQISFTQKLKMMYLVNPTLAAIILAGGLGLAALGIVGRAYADNSDKCTGTYVQFTDNIGNGGVGPPDNDMDATVRNDMGKHPIEFNINIDQIGNGELGIGGIGVDTTVADPLYINGNFKGNLSGTNGTYTISTFGVQISDVSLGNNLVQIYIDNDDGLGNDAINIDCGSLTLDPPVGGIARAPDIAYRGNLRNPDSGFSAGETMGIAAGAAAGALALGGAGYGALKRRK